MTTPIFGLPEWAANQNQPHIPHNTALRILEALTQMSAISRSMTGPPTGSNDGDVYIVASSGAVDDFAGHENEIAIYISNAFEFVTPRDGMESWVQDDAERVRFIAGSPGAWVTL